SALESEHDQRSRANEARNDLIFRRALTDSTLTASIRLRARKFSGRATQRRYAFDRNYFDGKHPRPRCRGGCRESAARLCAQFSFAARQSLRSDETQPASAGQFESETRRARSGGVE